MAQKSDPSRTWEVRVAKVLNEVKILEKHSKLLKVGHFNGVTSISSRDVESFRGTGTASSMATRCKQFLVCESSLSPKLSDVLKHDVVLPYLIQFLQVDGYHFQEKSQAQLVYFWLAAETFRLSDQSQPQNRTHQINQTSTAAAVENRSKELEDQNEEREESNANQDVDDDEMLDIDVFGSGNPFADACNGEEQDSNPFKEFEMEEPVEEIEDENSDFGDFCLSGDSRTIRITMMPIMDDAAKFENQSDTANGVTSDLSNQIECANFFKQNAVNIFMRYICKDSTQSVDLPESLGTEIWDKICAHEGVNSSCFISAQNHVYSILLNEYFESFLSSSQFVNYQLDRITCRNVTFNDVLFCHVTVCYFMEFLQAISLQNVVTCFLALQNFKLNYDPNCSLSDANVLFNSYFNENSLSHFVQFPESVICVVEKKILEAKKIPMTAAQENNVQATIPSNVFDAPFVLLGNVLKVEIFPYFLKSRYYRQLKRELELSFFSMQDSQNGRQKDCGSHFGCKGTESENLLKAEMKFPGQEAPRWLFPVEDEFGDPKSKKNQKRTLGHVNAIGEYVSQYESLPGGMQGKETVGSKIKQLLTPGKSKKATEAEHEAWVTAHKIVNQVNRETMEAANISSSTSSAKRNNNASQNHRKYTNISDI